MKNLLFIALMVLGSLTFAQAPELFNYQGIARNSTGEIMADAPIGIQLVIHQTTATGAVVYQETHAPTTNSFGLFTIQIGAGTVVSGSMSAIDWGTDAYFLEVEMDASGGTSYTAMGTSQFISVPYALHAETVAIDNVDDADNDPVNEFNTSVTLSGTDLEITDGGGTITTDLSSLQDGVDDADNDPTNELQDISFSGTDLSISGGSTVDLSSLSDGVDDADNDPTNELQDISLSGSDLTLSGGSTVDLSGVSTDADWTVSGSDQYSAVSGNVGIGVSSPTEKLHLDGNFQMVDGASIYSPDNFNIGSSSISRFRYSSGTYYGSQSGLHTFFDGSTMGGTEVMRIDIGGNVGIGTSTPVDLLHIYGESGNIGYTIENNSNTASDFGAIRFVQDGGERGVIFTHQNDFYLNSSSTTAGDDILLGVNETGLQLGNVGIGTTAPQYKTHVMGTIMAETDGTGFILKEDSGDNQRAWLGLEGAGDAFFRLWDDVGTETMIRTNGDSYFMGGNIGIGTSSPTSVVHVIGGVLSQGTATTGAESFFNAQNSEGATMNIIFNEDDDRWLFRNGGFVKPILINQGSTTRLYIGTTISAGIGINTTAPTAHLSVNGDANKVGGGSWAVFSDARLKKNVKPYTDGLSTLLKIQTKTFQYNGLAGIKDTEKEYVGIIAQDMQEIAPYMVREVHYDNQDTGEQGDYLEFDPSAMDFMIVNAIKELNDRIVELEKQGKDLAEENEELKEELEALKSKDQEQTNQLSSTGK